MNRTSSIIPIAIILLILLPTPAGKFLFDLAGGLLLISLFIPIILTIFAWIGWKVIQSRMKKCDNCGASYSISLSQCPICGASTIKEENISNIPASSATIDVIAEKTD